MPSLTSIHKELLLEMCQSLFKEYDYIGLSLTQSNCIHFRSRSGEQMVSYSTIKNGKDTTEKFPLGIYSSKHIHWYELCLTKLPNRMFKNYKIGIGSIRHHQDVMLSLTNIHIIDYLYKQFKITH